GEVHDAVEAVADLTLREAEHDSVDVDVFAAGDLRMESGAELDECADTSVHAHRAARRFGDAGNELQRRALPRSVAADAAVRRAFRNAERDVGQGRERFVGPQIADDAPLQERALQRRELLAAVLAVDLRDVGELDGGAHAGTTKKRNHRATGTQRRTLL